MRQEEGRLRRRRSWRRGVVPAVAAVVVASLGGVGAAPTAAGSAVAQPGTAGVDGERREVAADADRSPDARSAARARRWPPTPGSTGVPDGTRLAPYKGSCTIRRPGTVIDRKVISCSPLSIDTTGVVISRSKVNGSILVGTQDDYEPSVVSDPEGDDPTRVTVLRSEIETPAGSDFRPISSSHYVVKRSYLHGTYSGAECHNACTIKWSYVHGFGSHASGMRILRNGTLKHNTIWCEPNPHSDDDGDGVADLDGGCSGNLTMYQEFGTPHDNLVKHNFFPAGWFYYSLKFNGEDAGRIRIIDNRFGRPRSGRRVADDWDPKPTNVWSGNTLVKGGVARP